MSNIFLGFNHKNGGAYKMMLDLIFEECHIMSVGQNIKKYRKEAGFTQVDLARRLDIIQTNISRWETDSIIPSLDTLKKLSKLLNVSVDAILFSEKDKRKLKISDKELFDKLQDLEKLSAEDRTTIVNLIEALKFRCKAG